MVARFEGGRRSSDGGLLVLREIERRLSVADRLAVCIDDPRDPESTVHTLSDIVRFRLLMIAAGYEDGNDATGLRSDPLFKMALERLPSGRDLCSQSTISRLENLPEKRTLLRLGRALVELYCASFRRVPRRITLDIDDTFGADKAAPPAPAKHSLPAPIRASVKFIEARLAEPFLKLNAIARHASTPPASSRVHDLYHMPAG